MPPRRRSPDDRLTSGEVAGLLRISQSSVARIPPTELPYWTTPRGSHRRYRLEHVQAYAAAHGLDLAPRDDASQPDGRRHDEPTPREDTPDA